MQRHTGSKFALVGPVARSMEPRGRKAEIVPRLLSVAVVASLLDVSPKTVRRLVDRGHLPVCRIGRQLRIRDDDLAAYIARSRIS